jgi:hypothetical protein
MDDQRDLYERLDLAIGAIAPREAPVDGAMRRGRGIKVRRRVVLAAGVAAVVAAGVVAVPWARHTASETPAPSYSATVRPPGPHSPPGLIASGTVNGQHWQIVAGRPGAGGAGRGQQIFLATGQALASGSSTSVPAAALASKDPALLIGLSCGPVQVQFGTVRAGVSAVRVRLGNGGTLTLHPAKVWGVRMVAFAIPLGAPVVSATAYSPRGEIATAIPFNAAGGPATFATWLKPGQHGLARASGRVGSGSYLGSTWSASAYLGPWGACLTGHADGADASSCVDAASAAALGTGVMLWTDGVPAVAVGSADRFVARVVVTSPDGKTTRMRLVTVGGVRFFAFPFGQGPKPWKWTAYDDSGRVIASDKVTPGT